MEMSRYARVPAKISELILEQQREKNEQAARK
jgi:hypothetical protein